MTILLGAIDAATGEVKLNGKLDIALTFRRKADMDSSVTLAKQYMKPMCRQGCKVTLSLSPFAHAFPLQIDTTNTRLCIYFRQARVKPVSQRPYWCLVVSQHTTVSSPNTAWSLRAATSGTTPRSPR